MLETAGLPEVFVVDLRLELEESLLDILEALLNIIRMKTTSILGKYLFGGGMVGRKQIAPTLVLPRKM